MQKHHNLHKKHFLKVFHVIRRHPGAYMAGYRPSRAAMPKSLPRKPAGLHKEASGLWDWAKKGWKWVKDKFSKHKGTIMEHAKKHASRAASHVASRVGDSAKRIGGRVLDKIEQVAENNIEHYVSKAEGKIEALGKKAESKLSKWDKKVTDGMPGKTGSGVVKDTAVRIARNLAIGRNMARRGPVFSQQFKRRSRAGVRAGIKAFRSSR